MINSFTGDYYFLSNFYMAPVNYNGWDYTNNEAAFQAQKTKNRRLKDSSYFLKLTHQKQKQQAERLI